MKIEVSNGEVVDRWAILVIKSAKLKSSAIDDALRIITEDVEFIFMMREVSDELVDKLVNVNKALWLIEDRIREKEAKQEFDDEFIELARSVYKTNDVRSQIKREINEKTKSVLIEEKKYIEYETK